MVAGLAAKNAKFMLQTHGLEIPSIQKVGSSLVFGYLLIVDLCAHNNRIIVAAAVVRHRHDCGVDVRARLGNRLLKLGRERGYAALTRQGVADECQSSRWNQM